ncbi:MAG TPA: bifunctional glycosyltransferase family 2/GtrA family protein [Candidatus Kapabacteria bacterium]|nr:bifunctional glycosyltransferase family 2/GtrA family protein [Candidatus Kapabacteria bacterium]
MNIPVLIPAYNPDEILLQVVAGLVQAHFDHIIIVDDGSKPGCAPIFNRLEKIAQCHVLTHAQNCGKGRALKTGLRYFYDHFPGSDGIVTADADGQHLSADILKVAQELTKRKGQLILGVREMDRNVPFKSLFGNVLTRFVFRFITGAKISDTQSGLRGLPRSLIKPLLDITGERYEYEINMLTWAALKTGPIVEIPIDTIYIEDNKRSHFNPFSDSLKIYSQLLRYLFFSILTGVLDFILFLILFRWTGSIILSLVVGKPAAGALFDFFIHKGKVFHKSGITRLLKYHFALISMSLVTYLLMVMAMQWLAVSTVAAKIMVEILLFGINYFIQREFVFRWGAC